MADCLSRKLHIINIIDAVIFEHLPINDIRNLEIVQEIQVTDIKLYKSQQNDRFCREIIKAINNDKTDYKFKKWSRKYIIHNQILYYKRYSPNQDI